MNLYNYLIVSVVMPVYNEEKYIDKCIESLAKQDYPLEKTEWIFVDGMSTDRTLEILKQYKTKFPNIQIIQNPKKIVPYAMNLGIEKAQGKYIIRLDAHLEYADDYITKCVYYLDNTDADNVGGIYETKAKGFVGNAIAKVLSSKFGVGDSQFRTNGESGYVDSVPFGAFRREVFEKWGGFDVRLVRNQDNEINYRIRKNGGKVYMASDIKSVYYCRDTVKGLIQYAMQNGMWNIITTKLCPGTMGLRHFIPFIFDCSLIILPILAIFLTFFRWLFFVELILYTTLDIVFTLKASSNLSEIGLLLGLFPLFHMSYGLGSMIGIKRIFSKEYK